MNRLLNQQNDFITILQKAYIFTYTDQRKLILALLGCAVGAAVGALTDSNDIDFGDPIGR